LLRTDITQFYPALYTHTIPWALHTKLVCKTALSTPDKGKSLTGSLIDSALQCANEGQTHGIPIGPDASLVVAEVLLAAIDQALIARCPNLVRGFRYVDDFELAFTKLSDAEQVLMELQGILASFELNLNPRKTKIQELPIPLDDSWAIELGRFPLRRKGTAISQRNDFIALFSRAFELAVERPEDSILKYVIARVQNEDVDTKGWRAFQNCVLGAAGAEPSSLATAFGTLHHAATTGGHSVSKAPLAEVFEGIILRHAPRGEGSEVAWALWGALAWSVPLSADVARAVGTLDDDVVALLSLDADSRGLFPAGSLDKQQWSNIVSQAGVLLTEHWLLAYEANHQKWLASPALAKHAEFKAMEKAGVSFYDRAENRPQVPSAAGGIPGGRLSDFYA
jgi:hypothetical protein